MFCCLVCVCVFFSCLFCIFLLCTFHTIFHNNNNQTKMQTEHKLSHKLLITAQSTIHYCLILSSIFVHLVQRLYSINHRGPVIMPQHAYKLNQRSQTQPGCTGIAALVTLNKGSIFCGHWNTESATKVQQMNNN